MTRPCFDFVFLQMIPRRIIHTNATENMFSKFSKRPERLSISFGEMNEFRGEFDKEIRENDREDKRATALEQNNEMINKICTDVHSLHQKVDKVNEKVDNLQLQMKEMGKVVEGFVAKTKKDIEKCFEDKTRGLRDEFLKEMANDRNSQRLELQK